jgi:acyl transferase domain-containing protein
VVVLKRLSGRASATGTGAGGDPRHGGQPGRAQQGLTAPNGPAQERVIRRRWRRPGWCRRTSTRRGHGTGTALGDPIEVRALAAVFGPGDRPERPLWLGVVEVEPRAHAGGGGGGGVMKVVLALQHGRMPRTLHAAQPSPHIRGRRACRSRCRRGTRVAARSRAGGAAGVSSFGLSGTNAHVVLEEAPRSAWGRRAA